MQSTADEMKAEAESLPDGHPEKEKLLHYAELGSSFLAVESQNAKNV